MDLRVTESADWNAIMDAASVVGTCIRVGTMNNERAKESWGNGRVRYWLVEL